MSSENFYSTFTIVKVVSILLLQNIKQLRFNVEIIVRIIFLHVLEKGSLRLLE